MLHLQVIIASTRPERKGPVVADWFLKIAKNNPDFEVELIDLADVDLPLFNEPKHPRMQQYEHEHTRQWSETIDRADAYIFVTPEYNFGPPPSLSNAFTYLAKEWGYKPAAFVSYGGVSGGTRAVQMIKQTLTTLSVMPITAAVSLPFFAKSIDDETNKFTPDEVQNEAATAMLGELARWAEALKPMRS